MEPEALLRLLRPYWRSIVAVLLIVAAGSTLALMVQPKVYTANAQVNFLPKKGATNYDLTSIMDFAQTQASVYAQLAKTPVILEPSRQALGLSTPVGRLANMVTATVDKNQPMVSVTVRSADPALSASLANAVADQIVMAIPDYSPSETNRAITVAVTLPAVAPLTPSEPNLLQSLLVAMLAGAVAALLQAVTRSRLNTRIGSADDVALVTPLPLMAQIPIEREGRGSDHFSPVGESFADLRTNLDFRALEGGDNVLLVTSSIPGEGKTSTAIELSRVMAKRGQRVLLVDCDLRRPRIHTALGLESTPGLTNALLRSVEIADIVQPVDGIHVLVAGRQPPNPAELLASASMTLLLDHARSTYDVVIVDAPPLLPVTDAVALSRTGAGVLVVVESGRTRRRQLQDALTKLQSVKASVLGVVLNKVKAGTHGYYAYGYSYGREQAGAHRAYAAEGSPERGATASESLQVGLKELGTLPHVRPRGIATYPSAHD